MLTREQGEFLERVRESQNDTRWRCHFRPEGTFSNPDGINNPLNPGDPIRLEELLESSLRSHP